MLLVHALEMSSDPVGLLREVWRVLAAGGRLLVVVPNRRGVWARMDSTPFGHGRPYSRSQIMQLLRETWFTPTGWDEALYVPPIPRGWFLRSAMAWERAGATLASPFAGVHIVEATKQVYRAIPAPRREKRRRFRCSSRCWRRRRARRRCADGRHAMETLHRSIFLKELKNTFPQLTDKINAQYGLLNLEVHVFVDFAQRCVADTTWGKSD